MGEEGCGARSIDAIAAGMGTNSQYWGLPTINRTVAVEIGTSDHLLNLLVGGALTERQQHLAQFRGRDGAAVVLVKDLEGGDKLGVGVGIFA